MRLPSDNTRGGFTLAEVAVTLLIVGVGLVLVLQGLNTARATAFQTHNRKVARELALQTLGQLEAGLFWEDIDDHMVGNYAEEGYEGWDWEVVLGDETFIDDDDRYDEDSGVLFDTYRERDIREEEARDDDDEEDEEDQAEEPFEKVRIRVTFPRMSETFPNFVTLERWVPWEQVYGSGEDGVEPTEEPIQ